jgi:hypothetical protein
MTYFVKNLLKNIKSSTYNLILYCITRIRIYFSLLIPEINELIKRILATVIVVLHNNHAHLYS